MRGILKPLQSAPGFQSLVRGLKKNYRHQLVTGLSGSLKSYLLAGLAEEVKPLPLLVVTPGEKDAGIGSGRTDRVLARYCDPAVSSSAALPYQVLAQSKRAGGSAPAGAGRTDQGERMIARWPPVKPLLRRLVSPEVFCAEVVNLAVGDRVDLNGLLGRLPGLGYERVDLVEGRGQYALRGGILDVFPMTAHRPSRLEFFDDEIDSIRRFNPSTQRTEEKAASLVIYPARELVVSQGAREAAWKLVEKEYREQERKLNRSGAGEAVRQLRERFGQVLEGAEGSFAGIEHFLPYFYKEVVTLVDYLPAGAPVFVDDPARLKEVAGSVQRERADTYAELLGKGSVLPSQYQAWVEWDRIENWRAAWHHASLLGVSCSRPGPEQVHFAGKTLPIFGNQPAEIHHWRQAGNAVIILVSGYQRAQQLLSALRDENVDAFYTGALEGHVRTGNVVITTGNLGGGFELPGCKLVVIAEPDLYGRRKKPRKKWQRTDRLAPFVELKAGDYVVHVNHGIGRYLGVVPLTLGDRKPAAEVCREDKLYPVDQVGDPEIPEQRG